MRVLGLVRKEIGACEAYRVTYPLTAMRTLGHEAYSTTLDEFWASTQLGKTPWIGYDMILFQRMLIKQDVPDDFDQAMKLLRQDGISVVVDYDDDYTNTHRHVHDNRLPDLHSFSAVTVSTPYLKKIMRGYASDIHVIPNMIPMQMFRGFKRWFPEDVTVIGLTGSPSHQIDWEVVIDPIADICKKYKNTLLFVTGFMPEYIKDEDWTWTLRRMDPKISSKMKDDNFFLPLQQYGFVMRNIDILLCPVNPVDKFSWSKSNLKSLEGMASPRPMSNGDTGGCAVIATGDLPIYLDSVKHGKTGLLVNHNDKKAWYDAIDSLLADRDSMQRMQVRGHEFCSKNFNIETRINERVSLYREIHDKDRVAALKSRSSR